MAPGDLQFIAARTRANILKEQGFTVASLLEIICKCNICSEMVTKK